MVPAKVTFSAAGFAFGAGCGGGGGGGAGLTSGAGGGAGFGGSCVAHPAANANATRSSQLFLIILPPVPKTFSYQESACCSSAFCHNCQRVSKPENAPPRRTPSRTSSSPFTKTCVTCSRPAAYTRCDTAL